MASEMLEKVLRAEQADSDAYAAALDRADEIKLKAVKDAELKKIEITEKAKSDASAITEKAQKDAEKSVSESAVSAKADADKIFGDAMLKKDAAIAAVIAEIV